MKISLPNNHKTLQEKQNNKGKSAMPSGRRASVSNDKGVRQAAIMPPKNNQHIIQQSPKVVQRADIAEELHFIDSGAAYITQNTHLYATSKRGINLFKEHARVIQGAKIRVDSTKMMGGKVLAKIEVKDIDGKLAEGWKERGYALTFIKVDRTDYLSRREDDTEKLTEQYDDILDNHEALLSLLANSSTKGQRAADVFKLVTEAFMPAIPGIKGAGGLLMKGVNKGIGMAGKKGILKGMEKGTGKLTDVGKKESLRKNVFGKTDDTALGTKTIGDVKKAIKEAPLKYAASKLKKYLKKYVPFLKVLFLGKDIYQQMKHQYTNLKDDLIDADELRKVMQNIWKAIENSELSDREKDSYQNRIFELINIRRVHKRTILAKLDAKVKKSMKNRRVANMASLVGNLGERQLNRFQALDEARTFEDDRQRLDQQIANRGRRATSLNLADLTNFNEERAVNPPLNQENQAVQPLEAIPEEQPAESMQEPLTTTASDTLKKDMDTLVRKSVMDEKNEIESKIEEVGATNTVEKVGPTSNNEALSSSTKLETITPTELKQEEQTMNPEPDKYAVDDSISDEELDRLVEELNKRKSEIVAEKQEIEQANNSSSQQTSATKKVAMLN